MDIQMPVMNGYEATQIIRRLPGKRGAVPIVALTAFAQPSDREQALAVGMNDFLRKPLRKEDLVSLLNGMFGNRSVDDAPRPEAACTRLIAFQKAIYRGNYLNLRLAVTGEPSVDCPYCGTRVHFSIGQIERRKVMLSEG